MIRTLVAAILVVMGLAAIAAFAQDREPDPQGWPKPKAFVDCKTLHGSGVVAFEIDGSRYIILATCPAPESSRV